MTDGIAEFAVTTWSERPALALGMVEQAFNQVIENMISDIASRMNAIIPAENKALMLNC